MKISGRKCTEPCKEDIDTVGYKNHHFHLQSSIWASITCIHYAFYQHSLLLIFFEKKSLKAKVTYKAFAACPLLNMNRSL